MTTFIVAPPGLDAIAVEGLFRGRALVIVVVDANVAETVSPGGGT